jgi:hypothetical protein
MRVYEDIDLRAWQLRDQGWEVETEFPTMQGWCLCSHCYDNSNGKYTIRLHTRDMKHVYIGQDAIKHLKKIFGTEEAPTVYFEENLD